MKSEKNDIPPSVKDSLIKESPVPVIIFSKDLVCINHSDLFRQTFNLDQFYPSDNWLNEAENSYVFKKVAVFNHPRLITKTGRYKGYPFRSYSAGQYQGGFSDHFPVQLFIAKEVQ